MHPLGMSVLQVPRFEKSLTDSGVLLVKYWRAPTPTRPLPTQPPPAPHPLCTRKLWRAGSDSRTARLLRQPSVLLRIMRRLLKKAPVAICLCARSYFTPGWTSMTRNRRRAPLHDIPTPNPRQRPAMLLLRAHLSAPPCFLQRSHQALTCAPAPRPSPPSPLSGAVPRPPQPPLEAVEAEPDGPVRPEARARGGNAPAPCSALTACLLLWLLRR